MNHRTLKAKLLSVPRSERKNLKECAEQLDAEIKTLSAKFTLLGEVSVCMCVVVTVFFNLICKCLYIITSTETLLMFVTAHEGELMAEGDEGGIWDVRGNDAGKHDQGCESDRRSIITHPHPPPPPERCRRMRQP